MSEFLMKNVKTLLIVCLVVIVGAGAYALQLTMSVSKEKQAQEKFFGLEKKYNDIKAKKAPAAPLAKDAKKPVVDVSKETAELKKELESFIGENKNSKATQMAAVYYAEILRDEKNYQQALDVLQKTQNQDKGLLNTLVQQQIGQLLADSNKCKEAVDVWQKIVDRKEASFLHDDVRIQQALCYQQLNDLKKAEELLTNVANQKTEGRADFAAREAAKYLRLIQAKKLAGS